MKLPPEQVHANLLSIVEPMDNVLAAVVRHHRPQDSPPECTGCDPGKYAEEYTGWPCSTIDLILKELELDPCTGLRPAPVQTFTVQLDQNPGQP